ncbi:hypothetical protein TrRE_jg11861 [Triparma retinervis]|uniref:Uncharacterized protein n=1 Tax=Triparma retinervis TaxID=2557542 RepID=A0A9W7KTR5_9STRA|nr:hypothetical protein TrRE_jg11861 [Triparma retinervis]
MMNKLLSSLALLPLALSCPFDLCDVPDSGSCGNACCKLSVAVPLPTEAVMSAINATLASGGPDGLYEAQMTAEGTLGFADLRPFGAPADFIGQAFHATANGLYVDTVNFNLSPTEDGGGTVVRAFSTSQVGGAFGDDGQNYYNIVGLLTEVDFGGDKADVNDFVNVDESCPKPAKR